MKGQYLAVESVLTFGLGLIAAIGIISVFSTYSDGIYATAEDVQAEIMMERVLNNMYSIRPVKGTASRDVDLSNDIAGSDYQLILNDGVIIDVNGERYRSDTPDSWQIQGSGSEDVVIRKSEGTKFRIEDR